MQEHRVTFEAPHYVSENISSSEGLFDAETHLSQFLAAHLSDSGLVVGPAVEEVKINSVARQVKVEDSTFWVFVSYDRSRGQWEVVITKHWIISFLRLRTDPKKGHQLRELVDQSLRKDAGITQIEWRTEGE